MTTTPQHDPAAHRRAMVAEAEAGAAAAAAHRRAMELFDQEQALRIARSALIRGAGGPLTLDPMPADVLEKVRALDARIAQLEREAAAAFRAAELAEQRHYRAIEACGWSVDDA